MTTSVILAALHDVELEVRKLPTALGIVRVDEVLDILRRARADHEPDLAAEIAREKQDALENARADEERKGAP